jgi:hypothetical protein
MTDIERKAREYATDRGYGRGTKDWHAAVEDFLAGSKEGQREAFEAGRIEGYELCRADAKLAIERGIEKFVASLSRKEGE